MAIYRNVFVAAALAAAFFLAVPAHAGSKSNSGSGGSSSKPPSGGSSNSNSNNSNKFPGSDAAAVSQAEINGTMQLAQITVGRMALDEEPGIGGGDKQALGSLYDDQESTVKQNLPKLKNGGDDTKSAISAIKTAGDPTKRFLDGKPDVQSKLTKRTTIINAQLKDMTQSPDNFVKALGKAGVSGSALSDNKSLVQTAYQNRKADPSDSDSPHACRRKIMASLSSEQRTALDAAYGGK